MRLKRFFKGKRKFISIPILIVLSLILFPFAIGAGLSAAAIKYVPNKISRIIIIGVVALFTIPIGSGWVAGLTGQKATVDQQEKTSIENVTTEEKLITPAATLTPTPTIQSIPTSTPEPTSKPTPTSKPIPTPPKKLIIVYPTTTKVPVQIVQPQTQQIAQPIQQSGGSGCDCSLTCTEMTSCAEAQYQLNTCGCSARDADHDGTVCDSAPLHCQN